MVCTKEGEIRTSEKEIEKFFAELKDIKWYKASTNYRYIVDALSNMK